MRSERILVPNAIYVVVTRSVNEFPRYLVAPEKRIPAHFNAMCVVNQPLEDGISERRIADLVMQARDWQLRGQDSRAHLMAAFADPTEVAALRLRKWRHDPIIDHQHVEAAESVPPTSQAAISMSDRQVAEQRLKKSLFLRFCASAETLLKIQTKLPQTRARSSPTVVPLCRGGAPPGIFRRTSTWRYDRRQAATHTASLNMNRVVKVTVFSENERATSEPARITGPV
jgi:hypothetical protein